jgi:uncharacterized membrane protein
MKNEKRKYFITGLLIVLPVLITLYFFISLFSFFDNILGRYISRVTMEFLGYKIPGLGLIVFIVLIFVTGFFATNFIGRKILLYFEKIWFNFPIVRKVYPAVKQVTHFLFDDKIQGRFQKVVLVEYPSEGIYSIGFVTNDAAGVIKDKSGKDLLNILVSSVPNPLTGMLILMPREDVVFLDMTVEEAIKIVVSGGVFNPGDLRD